MLVMRLQAGARSHFVTRMPEWILSITLGCFAAQLLANSDAFETVPAYVLLSVFVSQLTWGLYAGVIAVFWFSALVVNGVVPVTRRYTPWVRMIGAFFASSFWAVNAWFNLLAAPKQVGIINNLGFAAMALALSLIVAREVGISEGKKNGHASRRT